MATNSHSIRINAPEEEILDAITTRKGLEGWYTPTVEEGTEESDEVVLHFRGNEGPFRWKIKQARPSKVVTWECLEGPGSSAGTKAVFRLTSKNERGTTLELNHDGLDEMNDKNTVCNTMWGALMLHLKKFVETKRPEPAFQ